MTPVAILHNVESYEEGKKYFSSIFFRFFSVFFGFQFDWILELNQLKSKKKKGFWIWFLIFFDFFCFFFSGLSLRQRS